MIYLKKYFDNKNKNIHIYLFLLFSVILFYLSIYILSYINQLLDIPIAKVFPNTIEPMNT